MTFEYFTLDELRALPDLDDPSDYDDARLSAAHDWMVGIVERECETSFVVRTVTNERVSGSGSNCLRLSAPYVRSVTAVVVDGLAYTVDQIAALWVEDGWVDLPVGYTWSTASRGNVTISYTSGYSATPPPDLKEAMLRGARQWVLTTSSWSGADSRSTGISNEYGNMQLSVAGKDAPTGIPDVDSTVMAWARKVRVPKVG